MTPGDAALPDDLDTAHRQIREPAETLRQQNHLIAKLQHQLEQLLRDRHGKKAEKVDPDQLLLFARDILAQAEPMSAPTQPPAPAVSLGGRIPEAQAARAEARLHPHLYDADRHPGIWSADPAESPRPMDPLRKAMPRSDGYGTRAIGDFRIREVGSMGLATWPRLAIFVACEAREHGHHQQHPKPIRHGRPPSGVAR
jgi:hypothetical protein